jgi:hypothetical protein
MPTIMTINGFRFFFYSAEGDEPTHIHVKKGEGDGKIWLEPEIEEEYLEGFTSQQKTQIRKFVIENRDYFIEKWHEYFQD